MNQDKTIQIIEADSTIQDHRRAIPPLLNEYAKDLLFLTKEL